MPKACIGGVIGGQLTTVGSAGATGVPTVAVVVVSTVHHNADGTVPKDTR